jgi:acyl-CoA synthetase (NDP forming)
VVWLAGLDQTAPARAILGAAGVPVFSSIAVAARVAGALVPVGRPDPAPPPRTLPDGLPATGWDLLDSLGVARAEGRFARTPAEAEAATAALGDTAVLKAVAPGLEHKTEAGAVRLDVPASQAGVVFAELAAAVPDLDGVLVQRMVPAGFELLVGATGGQDGWPAVLTVGLGGTGTEVHRDLATALAPIGPDGALALLRELRSWPLLAGHRGAPPLDVQAAVDVLVRVGQAVTHWPELAELEINPLIVGPTGAVAVDVLVTRR